MNFTKNVLGLKHGTQGQQKPMYYGHITFKAIMDEK
jgi:hypothetical protein